MKTPFAALAAAATLTAGLVVAGGADAHTRWARARLATADGTPIGTVDFRTDDGRTEVRVRLTGAPGPGTFHGFHVHANDVDANGSGCVADPAAAPSTWFVSADGHHNPTGGSHGDHAGDLPIVFVNADGSAETRFRLDRFAPGDLDGKAVVLHAGADNFGNIPVGTGATQYTPNTPDALGATARTGNAGDRVACGVISTR